jgi:hypothetical protein
MMGTRRFNLHGLIWLFLMVVGLGLGLFGNSSADPWSQASKFAEGPTEDLWGTDYLRRITPAGQNYSLSQEDRSPASNGTSIPLLKINDHLYQTEHCLFIVDTTHRINWPDFDSVYSEENKNYYISELKAHFPEDFFTVTILAANLTPDRVPFYGPWRYKAEGIGRGGQPGVPDICSYNVGQRPRPYRGFLGVFDHEIGHAWGVYIGPSTEGKSCDEGHWVPNSTAWCQMGAGVTFDNYRTIYRLLGDETKGFSCKEEYIPELNEASTFSGQQLYLMGLQATFPSLYVLNDVACNPDGTASYSSYKKYDHAAVVAANGARSPDYTESQKRFRLGFIYVVRDLDELNISFEDVEQGIDQFCSSEQIDQGEHVDLLYQVPFMVEALYRGSVDCRLADIDGNTAPRLSIESTYKLSSTGSASIPFVAEDPDGPPVVSCVPPSSNCLISGNTAIVQGLPNGAHFFTIKAEDGGHKKAFAHFVVDVMKPEGETVSVPETPIGSTVCLPGDIYAYTLGGAESSLGHGIEYRIDWGDGTYSDWSPSTNVQKVWNASGTYLVRVQARCIPDHIESNFSIGSVVYVPAKIDPIGNFTNITDTCIRANFYFINPEGTEYYFRNPGARTNSEWTTNMSWDSCGLNCGTNYSFWMKARYPESVYPPTSWWYFIGDQSTAPCEAVTVPSVTGPINGVTGVSYSYSANGASSNLGHSLEYQFDWKGDGSDLSPWGSPTQSKAWPAAGTCNVRARARCAQDSSVVSGWFSGLPVTIVPETVSTPTIPSGPTTGTTGRNYAYTTGASWSNVGHSVEYQFDWKGDGSELSAWGPSNQSKTWSASCVYNVRARARCTQDTSVISDWSSPLSVEISVPDILVTPRSYDFGIVKKNRSKTASLVVKNNGTVNLNMNSGMNGTDVSMFKITMNGGSKTIKPGKTLTIKVAFKPTSTGLKNAKLEITSNDPVSPTVDIALMGAGQ